jgi:hypothetical protein
MPSPLGSDHGDASAKAVGWLMQYSRQTPGVQVLGNATALLDDLSEMQPEASLRILP